MSTSQLSFRIDEFSIFPNGRIYEKRTFFGIWSIFFGLFCEILYIPCVTALGSDLHQSCFKIMFFLSIVDMSTLWANSISFGYLLIEGGDFCSHFSFNLWNGALGLGLWCTACGGCFLLGLNRIMELLDHSHIFEGHRTDIFLIFPVLYGLYFIFFTPPCLFNSYHQAMYFSPFIYEGNEYYSVYVNWPHTVNNLLVVFLNVCLSLIVCVVMMTKKIYLQCSVVCIFHVIGGIIYAYMNVFTTSPLIGQIGHISWQWIHGAPPMVYILLNRTIRKRAQRFIPFYLKWQKRKKKTYPSSIFSRSTSNMNGRSIAQFP